MKELGAGWLILTGILTFLIGIFIHPVIAVIGAILFLFGVVLYSD